MLLARNDEYCCRLLSPYITAGVLSGLQRVQHTLGEIAELVGYARSGVQQFLERFGTSDFEALLAPKKAPGKESPLQAVAVQEAIREGLRAGRWRTAPQLAQWLQAEHGIKRASESLYYWLGKLAGVLKVPRPVHLIQLPPGFRSVDSEVHPLKPMGTPANDLLDHGVGFFRGG